MSIFGKKIIIDRISDFGFLDKMSKDELISYIKKTEAELASLWETENKYRNGEITEKTSKTLEREQSITNKTLCKEKAKTKAGVGVPEFCTGKATYGEEPDPKAKLKITKVAFDTTYDICSDEIEDFSNEKYFWILADGGKYYHWLAERKTEANKKKPRPIPITFSSEQKIKFTATFKVITKETFKAAPQIRVTNVTNTAPGAIAKYFIYALGYIAAPPTAGTSIPAANKGGKAAEKAINNIVPHYKFNVAQGKTSGEFEVEFESNNTPYLNTVQYFNNFELLFEYSDDGGKTWVSAGSCKNELYLTWKKPLWYNFKKEEYGQKADLCSMKVKCGLTTKENILETLLWLGCEQAKGLGQNQNSNDKNEEEILDAIFKKFKTLKVERAREKKFAGIGMGYWRGKSAQVTTTEDTNFSKLRSLRYLLREGEARCGEWTRFLQHLLLTQGIDVSDFDNNTIAICTNTYKRFLHYNNKSKNSLVDKADSYNFAVKNAIITRYDHSASKVVTDGDSKGQGNQKAQPIFGDHIWFFFRKKLFYDPSYGKSYDAATSKLKNYCNDNITTIIMTDTTIVNKKIEDYLWADKSF